MIVVWSEPRARFEAITSYMERSLAKENRWRWDPAAKRWFAPSEDIARRLARFAQGPARLRLLGMEDHEWAALAASQAEDSGLAIPAPPGLDYLPYQRAGIAYALSRPHTLIGDEMGLGKTIQAIGVVNALGSGDDRRCDLVGNNRDDPDCRGGDVGQHFIAPSRVLIVCPASLRLNWRAEWRKWHTGSLRPYLLDIWPGGGLFDETAGKALIVSYDSVRKWHPQIAAIEWDVLIADEVHLVKDDGTRRAKSILGGTYQGKAFQPIRARRKLFLSGTPIVNKPAELWPLVKALAPEGLGKSRVDFMTRYGAGAAALDELHVRLRSQIMVRRLKENVLKQLPKKRRQVVLLDVDGAAGLLRAEAEVISLQQAALAKTRAEIEGLPHAEQVMRLRQCRAIALSEIARVRHETALKKLPAAIEHIHDILANCDKICVFAWHHDILDAVAGEFGAKLNRQNGAEIRRMDGDQARAEPQQNDDVAVPMQVRSASSHLGGVSRDRIVEGVHGLSRQETEREADDARSSSKLRLSDVGAGKGASQEGGASVRPGLAGHHDPGAMPDPGYTVNRLAQEGSRQQPVSGSIGASQGVYQGQYVGNQLEGEPHQRGRQRMGTGPHSGGGVGRARPPLAVQLDGRTPEADRQAAVTRFQNDRTCRLFVGNIRTAGLGITLTAASVVVFVELDWTPAAMMQAEDRLHRIGQVNPVLVQHLVIDGSIDAKMAGILIDKQAMMDQALDGGGPDAASRDILREVMRA